MAVLAAHCLAAGPIVADEEESAVTATSNKFGFLASSSRRPDAPGYGADLGAGWVQFEQTEAQEVPNRLSLCANGGGAVCLWFSLFDLRGEVDAFNHLGLLDSSVVPPRKKPAYGAFQSFVAQQTPTAGPTPTITPGPGKTPRPRGSAIQVPFRPSP